MEEIWKDADGFEGLYKVSNKGRVFSYRSNKPLKLRSGPSNRYQTVHLSLNGNIVDLYVHRLVANTFISNPDNYPYVDHIDGNTTNNKVSNLRWVNEFENSQCNSNTPTNPCLPVIQYGLDMTPIKRHLSVSDAAKSVNADVSDISRCCGGIRNKTVKGFIWRFEDEQGRNSK